MSAFFCKKSVFFGKNTIFTQSNSVRATLEIFSSIFSFFGDKKMLLMKIQGLRTMRPESGFRIALDWS